MIDKYAIVPMSACVFALIVQPLVLYASTGPRDQALQSLLQPRPENRIFWPAMAVISVVDPFSGVVVIFRSKRADRLKIVTWDGSGLVLVWKRLEHSAFRWPPITDGVMRLSPSQMAALFDGMDWSRLQARDVARPTATS
jgi:transposase